MGELAVGAGLLEVMRGLVRNLVGLYFCVLFCGRKLKGESRKGSVWCNMRPSPLVHIRLKMRMVEVFSVQRSPKEDRL